MTRYVGTRLFRAFIDQGQHLEMFLGSYRKPVQNLEYWSNVFLVSPNSLPRNTHPCIRFAHEQCVPLAVIRGAPAATTRADSGGVGMASSNQGSVTTHRSHQWGSVFLQGVHCHTQGVHVHMHGPLTCRLWIC